MLKELEQLIKACNRPLLVKLSVDDAIKLNEEIKNSAQNVEFTAFGAFANRAKFEVLTDDELVALYRKPEESAEGSYLTIDKHE